MGSVNIVVLNAEYVIPRNFVSFEWVDDTGFQILLAMVLLPYRYLEFCIAKKNFDFYLKYDKRSRSKNLSMLFQIHPVFKHL